ncbi:MAG: hypothetical protein KJ646_00710 [Nanoarchaeota archaeon]|nr:hypothetical protein [Nanoarchaeota archaeon]
MNIFDFFKKITKKNKVKEIVIKKLDFSEIQSWIENKTEKKKFKEKEIIFKVEAKIKHLVEELKEKIIILEDFDINAKKEQDRIKNIVADSREKYIESVEELIAKLNNLQESKLEKFIDKINKIFFEFDKKTFKNYERATILIGKEMASIKESLKVFSKELLKIFDENKSVITSFKHFLIINEKLNMLNQISKTLKEINEKKSNLNEKLNEKEKENKILKQNLEKIKTSHAYLENLAKQEKIKSLREELKKNILELKQILDFKALTNFFHINPGQMRIVKEHKENFQINFEKDNGKAIIELLDEAQLNNNIILEKINQIKTKMQETANHEQNLQKDETHETYLKIKEINLEIDNLKIEEFKENKREEKLKANQQELMSVLKKELGKINVEVV